MNNVIKIGLQLDEATYYKWLFNGRQAN